MNEAVADPVVTGARVETYCERGLVVVEDVHSPHEAARACAVPGGPMRTPPVPGTRRPARGMCTVVRNRFFERDAASSRTTAEFRAA